MTDGVESAGEAARRFAGELERLRVGLGELGITPATWLAVVPAGEWPVTAALAVMRELLADRQPEGGECSAGPGVFMFLVYEECGTCGVAAKQPCVGSPFGPHKGRETRWARAARVRAVAGGGVGGV